MLSKLWIIICCLKLILKPEDIIRSEQLSKTGVPIKGDLNMVHHVPIRMEELIFMPENWNSFILLLKKIEIIAPVPQNDAIWRACEE
jgi:23S rRNA pseudouridine1911/1915/1917 synthase